MNFIPRLIMLIFCSLLLILPLPAEEITGKIDTVMAEFVKLDYFSGTVLVARNGGIIYAKAFGEASKDFHVPNNLQTKFNIGSIGKIFTGTSIMQLAEQGKLDVMNPVKRYLPDFPFGDKILIHHLLTHTSGTFNYFAHPDFAKQINTIRSVSDALPLIYDQKLLFDTPGEKFSYSNSGIVILGAVIEKISGMPYRDYLQKNILGPLKMTDTGINYLEDVVENRATGYDRMISGEFKRNIYRVPPANADGGIETTVMDLLKFDQALYGTSVLSEESKSKMFIPFLEDYGYCWEIREEFGNIITSHGGGAPGVNAAFRRYTSDRFTLIVLSNYGGGATPVAQTIEAIIFGRAYDLPKPRVGEYIYKIISEKGSSYFVSNYKQILKAGGYQIRTSNILNRAGYELLFNRQIEIAIEIFKLNIKLFPDDANIHDSLGEAYMMKGNYARSRELYNKALELDPEFANAREMLQRLDELEKKE
jgi:CubicO group peptidase (beta-lactamase class C family)